MKPASKGPLATRVRAWVDGQQRKLEREAARDQALREHFGPAGRPKSVAGGKDNPGGETP